MDKMNVPFFKASISTEEEEAAIRVLRSGWLTTGNETHEFEKEFGKKIGAKYSLAVNSNTSGMIIADAKPADGAAAPAESAPAAEAAEAK